MSGQQDALQLVVRKIVKAIKPGCVFDSHFVISQLIKHHSTAYLNFVRGFSTPVKAAQVHGAIAKMIDLFAPKLIKRQGKDKAWSENIHGNPSPCACWHRNDCVAQRL